MHVPGAAAESPASGESAAGAADAALALPDILSVESPGPLPMHGVHRDVVAALVEENGGTIVHVELDERCAQAEADRVQKPFYFIEVERVAITGDTGMLTMGVELTLPSSSNFVKMCCCNAAVVFRRLNDRWTFVNRDLIRCR